MYVYSMNCTVLYCKVDDDDVNDEDDDDDVNTDLIPTIYHN